MNIIVEIIAIIACVLVWLLFSKRKDNLIEKEKTNHIDIYIEQLDKIYYAWHEKTFLYQDADTKTLVKYIKNKFPNNTIKITSNKELTWLQEIKEELKVN